MIWRALASEKEANGRECFARPLQETTRVLGTKRMRTSPNVWFVFCNFCQNGSPRALVSRAIVLRSGTRPSALNSISAIEDCYLLQDLGLAGAQAVRLARNISRVHIEKKKKRDS